MAMDMNHVDLYKPPDIDIHTYDKLKNPPIVERLSSEELKNLRGNPLEGMLVAENMGTNNLMGGVDDLPSKLNLDDIKNLHSNREYGQAIQKYLPVVDQLKGQNFGRDDNEKIAKFLHYFASANYRTGKLERAVEYGEWSVGLNSNDPEVLLDLGTYYRKVGLETGNRKYFLKYKETCDLVLAISPPDSSHHKKAKRRLKWINEVHLKNPNQK